MNKLIALTLACMTASCATTYNDNGYIPVIDFETHQYKTYSGDLRECQNLAKQRLSAGQGAGAGAIGGAIIGGLLMTAVTGNSDHLGRGMAAGAVGGAMGGAQAGHETQKSIVSKCMTGRGYRVLD